MRLSRIVIFPFALVGAYILYEMLVHHRYEWSYYLAIPVVVIAGCIALYPQIDALGYKWWKPKGDSRLRDIIEQSCPTLHWIQEDEREAFMIRLLQALRQVDFVGMKVEDIPTDVQAMCLYPAILLEWMFGAGLVREYNKVILYKHPFPSPQYKDWHSAEVYHEDGVVMFSLDQLIANYAKPGQYYHLGFDVWIRALLEKFILDLPQKPEPLPSVLFDVEDAQKFLGLDVRLEVQHLYAFLHAPEDYLSLVPAWGMFWERKMIKGRHMSRV